MSLDPHHAVYMVGFVAFFVIRYTYAFLTRGKSVAVSRRGMREYLLLASAYGTMFVLPLLAIFTPLLDFADYALPAWTLAPGAVAFAAAIFFFWRSHADLGRNWSQSLDIGTEHTLVTRGVYAHIRHPMYLSLVLYGVAQALLLGNWLAGPAALLSGIGFIVVRLDREEAMMIETFGPEYEAYRRRTGAVFPRFGGGRASGESGAA